MKLSAIAGLGLYLNPIDSFAYSLKGKKIGIIGLDTSHSLAFTKLLFQDSTNQFDGYKVVAAYPYGSKELLLSKERIPIAIEEIKKYNVAVVNSINELLKMVDVVLLETNDGRLHLQQATEVIEAGKPLFIDKPITTNLKDAANIFKLASSKKVPVFSSSSLRFMENVKKVNTGAHGKVLGADVYSPATIEKSHPDLFWYGIHGVETLFSVMGKDCQSVTRYYADGAEVVVGNWSDDRIGTFRGLRDGKTDFGGTAYCENQIVQLGPYLGYEPLMEEIIKFFNTGTAPVSADETLAIVAFMQAAQESKNKKGKTISIASTYKKAGL